MDESCVLMNLWDIGLPKELKEAISERLRQFCLEFEIPLV